MQELIINEKQDKRIIAFIQDGKLIEKYEQNNRIKRLEGNIYVGKVRNILPGMQAAFVDIGETKNAFIHLKDILPKKDIVKDSENQNEEMVKDIKQVIRVGMPILVEVKKDSNDKKGARVSTHLSLVSRYLVLMPNTNIVTISQKIEEKEEIERLKKIVEKYLPNYMGIIIRTSCRGKQEEEILKDLQLLEKRWNYIQKEFELTDSYPKLIEKNDDILKKLIMDTMDHGIERITTNTKESYQEIKKDLEELGKNVNITLELKEEDLLQRYDLAEQLEKACNRKVWLNCGGFITIDKTEALTAIDVNSAKYTGKQDVGETILKVNKEASKEIAKQLRLRDIGGIIIIDYIDMKSEEDRKIIIEELEEYLKQDRSKTQILGFTKLNLLEMTRKHICSNYQIEKGEEE